MTKESHPDVELCDDAEVAYYLIPFPKDREVMAVDEAQAIWEAQAQQSANEWQSKGRRRIVRNESNNLYFGGNVQ
jgi:hypothetical protein